MLRFESRGRKWSWEIVRDRGRLQCILGSGSTIPGPYNRGGRARLVLDGARVAVSGGHFLERERCKLISARKENSNRRLSAEVKLKNRANLVPRRKNRDQEAKRQLRQAE